MKTREGEEIVFTEQQKAMIRQIIDEVLAKEIPPADQPLFLRTESIELENGTKITRFQDGSDFLWVVDKEDNLISDNRLFLNEVVVGFTHEENADDFVDLDPRTQTDLVTLCKEAKKQGWF